MLGPLLTLAMACAPTPSDPVLTPLEVCEQRELARANCRMDAQSWWISDQEDGGQEPGYWFTELYDEQGRSVTFLGYQWQSPADQTVEPHTTILYQKDQFTFNDSDRTVHLYQDRYSRAEGSVADTLSEDSLTHLSDNPRHPALYDVKELFGEVSESGSVMQLFKSLDDQARLEEIEVSLVQGSWTIDVQTEDTGSGYSETWVNESPYTFPGFYKMPDYQYTEVNELERVVYTETQLRDKDVVYTEITLTEDGCAPAVELRGTGEGYEEPGENIHYDEGVFDYDDQGRLVRAGWTTWDTEDGEPTGETGYIDYRWSCPTPEETED